MRVLRALTGMWMAAVLVTWSVLFANLEKQSLGFVRVTSPGFVRFTLAAGLAGVIPALLYGVSLRVLVRGTRHFHILSLYPAAFPHLPLLWLAVVFSQDKGFLGPALAILAAGLLLTANAWWSRRPGRYLIALAAAGIPCCMLATWAGLHGSLYAEFCWAIGLWYAEDVTAAAWMMRSRETTSVPADSASCDQFED